jgi:hypothetical protein
VSQIHRLFLVVEGEENSYPNHESAKVYISPSDPSSLVLQSPIVCSPIFSISDEGITQIPDTTKSLKISFLVVPNSVPTFNYIKQNFDWSNELWFSIGLSNLIVIEDSESALAEDIVKYLKDGQNITAYETWRIENSKVVKEETRRFEFVNQDDKPVHINLALSEKLPNYLGFAVSEYILSVNKFLTSSKKFTPS